MGCEGWSYADVLPYFRRPSTRSAARANIHGVGGPLNVSDFTEQHPISARAARSLRRGRHPAHRDDINGGKQEGVTWFQ